VVNGFSLLKKDYTNTLVLCICETNKKMWGIPYSVVLGQMKLTVGLYKSKYNEYEFTDENIFKKLHETYNSLEKNTYEKRAFLYLDIISWLESKIENRKIGDIIREKAQLSNR
jgi:hypothetical protein